MSKLYTCEDIAERYGVKVFTVWGWIRNKKLPAMKIDKSYRIREEDIHKFESERMTIKPT